MDNEKIRRGTYSSPSLQEERFNAEGGFCLSQLEDFEENEVYIESFD